VSTPILAIAVDIFTASVFWKKYDLTVSTLCDVALAKNQRGFLFSLGRVLNYFFPGHTANARASDKGRALQALNYIL
jgi:hypothetical protein